jgi:pyridoxal phosphate enzyme (YggS family)
MSLIESNLQAVNRRIAAAAEAAGRDRAAITLMAVGKTFPSARLRQAFSAGQTHFGENYVQEAVQKIAELSDLSLTWHFIGPVQSNKTRDIAGHFDWVHSVEREKIARRLADARPLERAPLNICLQVNVSGEASKSGVAPAEVRALAEEVRRIPRLRLRGLMTIPEPTPDEALQRSRFAALRKQFEQLNLDGFGLDTLSMGMSQDLEAAIMEGATMVRVGTAIFGERTAK